MEKIATDITYLNSRGKVQYLNVFLDSYHSEILEYEVGNNDALQLVIQSLKRLFKKRNKGLTQTTTIHSDQGNQYTSKAYTLLLPRYGVNQSMSERVLL